MAENFDRALRDIGSEGASTVRLRTTEQIKDRARRRSAHRRAGAGVLSVVLACAVAGGAIGLFGNHGHDDVARPAAPSSTASTPITSTVATSTPTATHSVTPAVTPSTPPASASTTPVASLPSAGTYVPAAWLSPQQLPFYGTFHWTRQSAGGDPQETRLSSYVNEIRLDGIQQISECGPSPYTLYQEGAVGQADDVEEPGSSSTGGSQWLFFFKTPAEASAAMAAIPHDYESCDDTLKGGDPDAPTVDVEQSVGSPTYAAWTVTSQDTSPTPSNAAVDDAADTHDFYVLRGNVIAFVGVAGSPSVEDSSGDGTVISVIAQALAAAYPQA